MALSTSVGTASFDITSGTGKLDLSEELAEIIRTDNTAFIQRTGIGHFTANQLTHRWNQDELNPNTATVTEGAEFSASDVTLTVGTDEGARFKIGTIFKFNERNKTEVCQVTAISSDNLTVVRGYGTTSGETHADGTTIMILSHTKQEGWASTQEDWTKERTAKNNFLTTMGYGITLTYRRQAIDHAGIPSEWSHQTAYRLKEFMRQLDSSVINSIKSATEGSDTVYSSMEGLIESASAAGGNTNTTAEALTPTVMNAMVKQIWDDGGMVSGGRLFALMGGVQKRKVATFDQAYRRMDFEKRAAGYTVERFLSDLGFEIEILVDPWLPDDTVIIGDTGRVKIGPLTNDAVKLENLAKVGRRLEGQLSGSYTMECRNPLAAFAIHTNLSS